MNKIFLQTLIAAKALVVYSGVWATEYHHAEGTLEQTLYKKELSPCVGRSYPTKVLWADQHLHTQTSVDADTMTSDLRDFYCARGIEILTPRWTANDAKYYGIEPPPEVRVTITERASTSPIWDTHGKGAKVKFNRE